MALIAQQMEGEQEWVVQDPKLESLNTCFNPEVALKICFDEAMESKATLPSEEEFKNTQLLIGDPRTQQLLIEEKYKQKQRLQLEIGGPKEESNEQPMIEEPDDVGQSFGNTFVKLWREDLVKEDESNQVNAHNPISHRNRNLISNSLLTV